MRRASAGLCLALFVASCAGAGGDAASRGLIDPGSPVIFHNALTERLGKPVVVNFWATWCGPCKREMPLLVDAANTHEGRVHFLGVNVNDDLELANGFLESFDVPFRSLSDTDESIRRDQRVLGLPVTQFYDAEGELAYVHQGEITAEDLEDKIAEVLRLGSSVDAPDGA